LGHAGEIDAQKDIPHNVKGAPVVRCRKGRRSLRSNKDQGKSKCRDRSLESSCTQPWLVRGAGEADAANQPAKVVKVRNKKEGRAEKNHREVRARKCIRLKGGGRGNNAPRKSCGRTRTATGKVDEKPLPGSIRQQC